MPHTCLRVPLRAPNLRSKLPDSTAAAFLVSALQNLVQWAASPSGEQRRCVQQPLALRCAWSTASPICSCSKPSHSTALASLVSALQNLVQWAARPSGEQFPSRSPHAGSQSTVTMVWLICAHTRRGFLQNFPSATPPRRAWRAGSACSSHPQAGLLVDATLDRFLSMSDLRLDPWRQTKAPVVVTKVGPVR